MNVQEAIRKRKSVRSYRETPVDRETLEKILEAGRLAPSARNVQEWRYVVVEDRDTRARLAEAASNQRFVAEAPVVIVCCAETDHRTMQCGHEPFPIDVAISVDHMTLAAVEAGLGTCWVGAFDADRVREILGIPGNIEVVELLPLGYPRDDTTKEKKRLAFDQIVHFGRWGGER